MDIVSGEKLAREYEDLIGRAAADERIILSHGDQQAALVSIDDLMFLEEVDEELDRRDAPRVQAILNDPAETPMPFVRSAGTPAGLPGTPAGLPESDAVETEAARG